MNNDIAWLTMPTAVLDEKSRTAAYQRQQVLTKPAGSLGQLESLAIRLAAMQQTAAPTLTYVTIAVFAGDHGVANEGVSLFPQAVTAEMVRNFARGGAAISVLARQLDASLEVINLGTVLPIESLTGVRHYDLGPGTANFTHAPAMTEHQLARALHAGRHAVERAKLNNVQLFIAGDMGIGNTTATTALASALLNQTPATLNGPGTGLDASGVAHKTQVIQRALDLHLPHINSPLEALRRLGGFEIAAMTGAYIACAQLGIPILVDGFIATGAALVAARIQPAARDWMLFAHASAEPGHKMLVQALDAQPILNLGMRLGEGSGAAVAVPLLRLACALHNEMATFAEAGVSEKHS
ncbi:MAG: nicotinate-nucleotide--dimethylbenzimidazole phosphoribosyltransferase [Pseudomonadota bacterium]